MCTLLLALISAVAPSGGDMAIDPSRAAQYFAEAEACGVADEGQLWGVQLYGPMLLVDRMSRQVVANRADAEGHLEERHGVFVGALPDELNIANTAVDWAGVKWTMLIWPLPEHRYRRQRLMTHECFHRIQDDIGLPMTDPDCGHLDTRDGRTWMRLEFRALSEALIRRDEDRNQAISDALIFRGYRRSLFPQRVGDERGLELNEGLAEYTGFALSGLPAHVLADRAAIQLDDYESRPSFVRNFAYASGPAYGILLDEAGTEWRSSLTNVSDLGELLRAALGNPVLDAPMLATEAKARAGRYDGQRVIEAEAERHRRREARLAEMRRRFVEGPVLIARPGGQFGYSFDPNGVEAFGDIGLVYDPTRVTDEWGILDVSAGGALMVRDGTGISRLIVPAPEDRDARPLRGDGWTLELVEGWSLQPGERDGDFELVRE